MNLPTIRQLRYFIALERHRHFAQAARACFVSPSAFSIAIRDLERLLDVQLVDRTNKQVTITATGQDVANQARCCLRDLEHLIELAQNQRNPLSGRLKLGIIPTIAPFLLPRVLPRLRRHYPELRLYLHEGLTEDLYGRLMSGDIDLILIALPYELRGVTTLPLFDDPFYLACHAQTRFLDPEHYDISRLPDDSILLLEEGHCLREHVLVACALRRSDQISRFSASSLLTLVQMVDADLGITYLPRMALDSSLLQNTELRTYALPEEGRRQVGLVWRQGSAFGEPFRLLGRFIASIGETFTGGDGAGQAQGADPGNPDAGTPAGPGD